MLPDHALEERGPLSFVQQRMWVANRLLPKVPNYNICLNWLCRGRNLEPVRQALAEIVRRHSILRTRYEERESRTEQVISAAWEFQFPVVDLRDIEPGSRRDALIERLVCEADQRPFDLSRDMPLRAVCLRLEDDRFALLITVHHIAFDGASHSVFYSELGYLVRRFATGEPSLLPELPHQYIEYARFQREKWDVANDILTAQLEKWRAQSYEPATIPTDRPRPVLPTRRAEEIPFKLDGDVSQAVISLARARRCSVFQILLTALQVTLSRCGLQTQTVVAFPTANRANPSSKSAIGCFVNTSVVAADLSRFATFGDLLEHVKKETFQAYENQDLPFDKLVGVLMPGRDLSQNPLFQVMVQMVPGSTYRQDGSNPSGTNRLPWEPLRSAFSQTARFDLELLHRVVNGSIYGQAVYATDLFLRPTIESFIHTYRGIVEDAVGNPDKHISELCKTIMRAASLPASASAGAPAETLPRLFAAVVARQPDVIAVTWGRESLSYRELDRSSERVANRLAAWGFGPGSLLGLHMDRGMDLIVAIVGVLKSGAAYVPMDPTNPVERKRFSIIDSGMSAVIYSDPEPIRIDQIDNVVCVPWSVLWSEGHENGKLSDQKDRPSPMGSDAAYVIYTSGSTGRPKGVVVPHAAVARLVTEVQDYFHFDAHDVWTLFHSCAFDVSVFEMWGALLNGGRLVIVPYDVGRAPASFLDLLRESRTTVLCQTPSAFQLLLAEQRILEAKLPLRHIIFAGETLSPNLLASWMEAYGDAAPRLTNMYGTTETTVHATIRRIEFKDQHRYAGSPVGVPISDLRITLCQDDAVVPKGAIGEFCISGPGVALGYLNRPGLTAARFVPDPCGPPGERRYRTGDVGRWHPDGELEYLGRRDSQVKVNGYRIELGEVVHAMNSHACVCESTCVLDRQADSPRLVAYVAVKSSDASEGYGRRIVADWQALYDGFYGNQGQVADFDTTTWNSSYTKTPMPELHMREWVDNAVGRIHNLSPQRILEIGCGTGLLLFRLAPECSSYVASDISGTVLKRLQSELRARAISNVSLQQRDALSWREEQTERFDTIVLNSVVQHFPSLEYLLGVLRAVVSLVGDGGSVFIGDVRDRRLADIFHSSVAMFRAAPTATFAELRHQCRTAAASDPELTIDPRFFFAFARSLGRPCSVEVELKQGRRLNEMLAFRYDVTLRFDHAACREVITPDMTLRWSVGVLDQLTAAFRRETPRIFLEKAQNKRLGLVRAKSLFLASGADREPAARLYDVCPQENLADPQQLHELGESFGYVVKTYCSSDPYEFDVMFARDRSESRQINLAATDRPQRDEDWDQYVNFPLGAMLSMSLGKELRAHLSERVPRYMIPAEFVIVPRLPRLSSGKLDLGSLPPSAAARPSGGADPSTHLERCLAKLILEVVGIRLGVDENIFERGIDSIQVVRLISAARKAEMAVEPTDPFRYQTIRELAVAIGARGNQKCEIVESFRPAAMIQLPTAEQVAEASRGRIKASQIEAIYPATPFQSYMVARHLLEPHSEMHHCVLNNTRWNMRLDPGRFRSALNVTFQQHPWLRISIESRGFDRPVQVIRSHWPGPLVDEFDFRDLTPEEQRDAILEHAELDRATPFPLDEPHVYRFKLFRVTDDTCSVIRSIHYARGDGWSNEFVEESIWCAYLGAPASQSHRPPYGLYADWLRQQDTGRLKEHWLAKLNGYRPRPVFSDRNPTGENLGFDRRWARLSRDLLIRLVASARDLGVTPATLFASAWSLVCEAWGGEDVCFGVSLAGRPAEIPDIDHMSGPQLTILPIRLAVPRDIQFGKLAHIVQREVGELVANSHTLQTEIHDWCDIPLTQSLFESYIYLRNYPQAGQTGFESTAQRAVPYMPYHSTGFPLRVEVGRLFSEDFICLYYFKRFFSSQRIALLLQQFVDLLAEISLRPHSSCSALSSCVVTVKS